VTLRLCPSVTPTPVLLDAGEIPLPASKTGTARTIRVLVDSRRGVKRANVRLWIDSGEGWYPTREGVVLPLASVPAFAAMVDRVREFAEAELQPAAA
jgi:hypothetical protein